MTDCVSHLSQLISYPTHNPGGDELALCAYLADQLTARDALDVEVIPVSKDQGAGGYVHARYGDPRVLVNAHVDTVPPNTGWQRVPQVASVEGDRIYGLGAADTKGAIAALLSAIDHKRPSNLAILFSGDEEASSTCMAHYLATHRPATVTHAIVCEPTARRAGVRHRGISSFRAHLPGRGGHSSAADALPKPILAMARLAVELSAIGDTFPTIGVADMQGLCLNIAAIDGGVAFNVVPDAGSLVFSIRPPPNFDHDSFESRVRAAATQLDGAISVDVTLKRPPFACSDQARFHPWLGNHVADWVTLDFWTEAAMLSAAGIDAVVVGPGDIAQAHAADEYVTLADLEWMTALFVRLFDTL